MRRVIIESPYKGATKEEALENIRYAQECCRHATEQGDVPFASHLFFTQFLDDSVPEQRKLGIEMGYDYWDKADKIIFYMDRGMSGGMKEALARAFEMNKPFEKRYIAGQVGVGAAAYAPPQIRQPVDLDKALKETVTHALGGNRQA